MRLIIAGDFCDKNHVRKIEESGQYELLFGNIANIIRSADYAIVNFEMPIDDNLEYEPELKSGCVLRGSKNSIEAIKFAGFRLCTLANNHIMDLGPDACLSTKKQIESSGLDVVGVGKDIEEASMVKYIPIHNEVLAVINCCEHEFSIAANDKPGACPIDPILQYRQIQEARIRSDYILVIVHGGHEHFQYPSERMQKTYRFFIDAGADAVVNHHQHCFCGYEVYHDKPIFYGLGNFCFDEPQETHTTWNEGYLAEIDFQLSGRHKYLIRPYIQCKDDISVQPMTDRSEFDAKIKELNSIIESPVLLKKHQDCYYFSRATRALTLLEPYFGRVTNKLFRLKLLPRTLTKTHFLCLENMIECESHRDILLYALKHRYDEINSR